MTTNPDDALVAEMFSGTKNYLEIYIGVMTDHVAKLANENQITSVSTIQIKIFFAPLSGASMTWSTILVSASSWSEFAISCSPTTITNHLFLPPPPWLPSRLIPMDRSRQKRPFDTGAWHLGKSPLDAGAQTLGAGARPPKPNQIPPPFLPGLSIPHSDICLQPH